MTGIPNIVTRRLQAMAKPDVHPGPDLLAAFVERSLAQSDQNDLLRHLAECSECREVLAFSVPEQIDVTETIRVRPSWSSWPVLRWGAVVACVVVVGAAISLHHESLTTPHQGSLPTSDVAVVKTEPMAASKASSVATPVREAEPASEPRSSPLPSITGKLSNLQAGRTSGAAKALLPQSQGTRSVPGAMPLSANAQPPESALNIPGRAKDNDEDGQSANAKLDAALGTGAETSSAMTARAAVVPANVIPRWTLTADGMLQRSIDSGKTWETILVASPGVLRALTANGLDIWVAGARGALYHSIDAGQRWMQVQPAADGSVLTADITAIEFDDLRNGTLTTADGQTWTTADAGRSWTQQQ
jgi:hypothetical protein